MKTEIIAGPCSINSYEDLLETAMAAKKAGATAIRAGVLKPRTKPTSYQGLGIEGLECLARVRDEVGLPIVTEARDVASVDAVAQVADIIQIGSRNMQMYELLTTVAKAAAKHERKVLLKRHFAANHTEIMGAIEYLKQYLPEEKIMFCERGIRTFENTYSRFTLDINIFPYWREHCPGITIIADPSHSAGEAKYVPQIALAALAAGAQGLLIEARVRPEDEQCDRKQTIDIPTLKQVVELAGRMQYQTG